MNLMVIFWLFLLRLLFLGQTFVNISLQIIQLGKNKDIFVVNILIDST